MQREGTESSFPDWGFRMSERVVKLAFRSPVHFGNGRLADGAYVCDAATIFSALYIEALRMGCAGELLEAAKEGELCLSDAHPYIGDTLYVPKPVGQVDPLALSSDGLTERDPRARKAAKKLTHLPLSRLSDYKDGRLDCAGELERFTLGVSSLRTNVNLSRKHGQDAEPYHVGSFSFAPDAGLYVIIRGSYDVMPIFDQLGYSGIGGKRSSGYGRFDCQVTETEDVRILSDSGSGEVPLMLLSSAAPAFCELDNDLLEGAGYRLIRKGGFVQSVTHSKTPQKKRDLYVFAAGSVFRHAFEGDVFDVNATPGSHAVYRYARAMWMEV